MDLSVNEMLADAMQWAREAGAIQLGYFRKDGLEISNKLNDADIVTAADKESEQLLISRISQKYPTHAILSEESGEKKSDDSIRWVIDPLDGTTNFSSGLPSFAVSIGIEMDGMTIAGVVYAPYLDEMFTAVKGEGAKLNGKPIQCNTTRSLSRCVISTGFPVDKDVNPDNNLDNVARVLPLIRGLRRLGSAALDISYVAAGFLDGYWEMNLHLWDVSAAMLIADEAGASAGQFRADRGISVIVAPPAIYSQLKKLIS